MFGINMQLGNGCGSGTLYTVGGSGRMIITLAFFIFGSVIGSFTACTRRSCGSAASIGLAADYLGPWGGLIATWAALARSRRWRHRAGAQAWSSVGNLPKIMIGAVLIGLLSIGVFARRPSSRAA